MLQDCGKISSLDLSVAGIASQQFTNISPVMEHKMNPLIIHILHQPERINVQIQKEKGLDNTVIFHFHILEKSNYK